MINPMSKQRHVHILVLCLFEFLLIPDSMSIHQNEFISRTIVEENDTIQRCQNPIQLMPSTRYALFKPLPLPQADTDLGVGALSAGTPPPPPLFLAPLVISMLGFQPPARSISSTNPPM
ncbi:hypothetical protein QL285_019436 [Trifolium repens]|nr:hypothetical protein QL285_019436 [Trifolium repens]